MIELNGKVIVVSGAAAGIGRVAAEAFVAAGASVVGFDLTEPKIEGVVGAVGDVTSEADWAAVAALASDRFGRVDGLINNAGIEGAIAPVVDYSTDEFRRVMEVNVTGVFLGMKYLAPAMTEGGSIVNVSSVAGMTGAANLSGYSASKHAVIGLTKSAAIEMGPVGIRVNTVCPSPVHTRMMDALEDGMINDEMDRAAVRAAVEASIPLGRYGESLDVAALMAFLVSDESVFLSGATIPIDGAMKAK